MLKASTLIGRRFGRLTVIGLAPTLKHKSRCVCVCDCGKEKVVGAANLVRLSTRSCGCLLAEITSARSKNNNFGSLYTNPEEAFVNVVIYDYRRTAESKGFEWALNREWCRVNFQNNCHYCGSCPLSVRKSKSSDRLYTYNGIDRVDNSKGYTLDNVVVCCKICNHAKATMTQSEFYAWIDRLIKHRSGNEIL